MSFHVDGLDRFEPTNHFAYTNEEMLEKKEWMEKLIRTCPRVDPLYLEWVYDVCKRTPQDELEEMKKRIDASSPRPPAIKSQTKA